MVTSPDWKALEGIQTQDRPRPDRPHGSPWWVLVAALKLEPMQPRDRAMIKALCLPLKELAAQLDTSYSNVRNWSSGAKEIPDKYRKPLATFMKKHAKRL